MKKLILLVFSTILLQGIVQAQTPRQVSEKEVKSKYVQDFQRLAPDAKQVQWSLIDENTFQANFLNTDNEKQAILFSNKGTETHFFIDPEYYPTFVKDTISKMHPKHTINELYVLKVKNKMTYQTKIAITKKKGILWWKKVESKDPKTVNFEIDGNFINEIDD